jgi:hypothetical protein
MNATRQVKFVTLKISAKRILQLRLAMGRMSFR